MGASGFVLHFGAFVLSGLVAGLTTALVASTLPTTLEEDEDRTLLLGIYMALSFAVAFSTLNFLATLLINVVDAAYTCHALDLEVGNLCTPACNPLKHARLQPPKHASLQPHVPSLQRTQPATARAQPATARTQPVIMRIAGRRRAPAADARCAPRRRQACHGRRAAAGRRGARYRRACRARPACPTRGLRRGRACQPSLAREKPAGSLRCAVSALRDGRLRLKRLTL